MQIESSISKEICRVRLQALMSIPRLGYQEHWGCVYDALSPLRIPIQRYIGVYWHQCIQGAIEAAIADEYEWVLSLDYDTLFTARDVHQLLAIFWNNPEFDALTGLQTKRSRDTALVTVDGATELEIDNEPVKIDAAHFGLTLFRLRAFARVPKPWFHGQPSEDGRWHVPGSADPDVAFWQRWKEYGNNVYLAPMVRLGHIEMMASYIDDDGQTRYEHIHEWCNRRRKCELAAE